MASVASTARKLPFASIAIGLCFILALIGGLVYLSRPVPPQPQSASASPQAKAYVSHLRLSEVTMQAAENFLKQRVVEVQGKISNEGSQTLRSVDIYCLFYSIDGREIYRERVSILGAKGAPLQPNETRSFRLPFDTLPDGWNQAVPHMVIAQITFAQ